MHVLLAAGYNPLDADHWQGRSFGHSTPGRRTRNPVDTQEWFDTFPQWHKDRCLKNDSLLAVNTASLTLSALIADNSVHSYKSNFPRTGMSVLPRDAITLLDHIPVLAIWNGQLRAFEQWKRDRLIEKKLLTKFMSAYENCKLFMFPYSSTASGTVLQLLSWRKISTNQPIMRIEDCSVTWTGQYDRLTTPLQSLSPLYSGRFLIRALPDESKI